MDYPNLQNEYPSSNDILWKMMMISLLIYQLDEYIEIISGTVEGITHFEAIKTILRQLCRFACPEKPNRENMTNGHVTNGHSDESNSTSRNSFEVFIHTGQGSNGKCNRNSTLKNK